MFSQSCGRRSSLLETQLPQRACVFSCLSADAENAASRLAQDVNPASLLRLPRQNQLILGVMGVDIAINEIKRKTPTYRVTDACH